MECQNSRSLIPSYLDGEITEAQAGPLRQHLLGCQPCRGSAQDLKNLKRWFAPSEAAVVPRGFASRIARRAFLGDTGELEPSLPARNEESGRLLQFVLAATAVAAGLLLVLAIGVRQIGLPHSDRMVADQGKPSLDKALEELDRLNRAEKAPHAAPMAPNVAPKAPNVAPKKP